jgi:hypothetical protein
MVTKEIVILVRQESISLPLWIPQDVWPDSLADVPGS